MLESLIQLDKELFLWLNNLGSPRWDWLWLFITDKWSSIPLYLFLLFLLYKKTNAQSALVTMLLVILLVTCTDQVSNLFKHGFERLRPCQMGWDSRTIANCGRYGFPSAHSFSSMALAIFMGKILKKNYSRAIYYLIGWSFLLGFSRIYVGVHYPTDVLTGFSLGVFFGFGFYHLRTYILKRIEWWSNLKIKSILQKGYTCIEDCWLYKYQIYFLYFGLVVISILYVRTEMNPHLFILEDTPYEIYYEMFAFFVSLIGFTLRFFTLAYNKERSLSIQEHPDREISEMNTTGIYSVMRHPFHVGNFLLCMGPVLWTGNYFFIALFFSAYWIFFTEIIELEEYFMEKKFGNTFTEWKSNTPAYFPKIRNFKKSDFKFKWKKILLKEIEILFLLMVVYISFEILGELIEDDKIELNLWLLLLGIIITATYTYLKFRKTNNLPSSH